MKILIADKFEKSGVEALGKLGATVLNKPEAGAGDLAATLASENPDILVVRSSKVSSAAINRAPALKLIVRAGAGFDNIDVPGASARRVAVCNCPGMNSIAVAELTMGLLIAIDRRIPDQTAAMKAGQWNKKEFAKGRGLKGMTLGVVGAGAIGRAVIKRANAFEMNVIVWSLNITPEHCRDLGAEFIGYDTPSLYRLAERSDAITVHLPAAPDTNKIIGAEFFKHMKPGSYLINTSRGSVVDEAALRVAAMEKGIRVGLDVYSGTPAEGQAPWKTPLSDIANSAFTHHVGASTDQAQNAVADETVRIIRVFIESGKAENCVNNV